VRSALGHGYQAIKLKFAGGEASLNFALVWELHEYAVAAAAAHRLELEAVVLSNGVGVSRAGLIELERRGIRLMISLDGIAADHDAQRVFANGRGSFAAVTRTIERALSDIRAGRPASNDGVNFAEFKSITNYDEWARIEDEYAPGRRAS